MVADIVRRLRELRKRGFRQRKGRHSDVVTDLPTPNENLLYLVSELEDAIDRATVEWSADLAAAVEHRSEVIVQVVRQIARRGASGLLEG
jgi:hypothetical protein